MLDKAVEQARARTVKRGLPQVLVPLGFEKLGEGRCVRIVDGAVWQISLQKFANQPAFRVVMSFAASGNAKPDIEFGDRWTYAKNPSGRQFKFDIRWGEDPAERCLEEIRAFVQLVAIPWFEQHVGRRA